MAVLARVSIDILLVSSATVLAVLLREDFATPLSRYIELWPYLLGTLVSSAVVLRLSGVSDLIWRFSSPYDHFRVLIAAAAVTGVALSFGFVWNRLDGVSRSLPTLQFLLTYLLLVGARGMTRSYRLSRFAARLRPTQFGQLSPRRPFTIVAVGTSRLTEAYLQLVDVIGVEKVQVAAVLGRHDRHKGRLMRNHRIAGSAEDIEAVLADLSIQGIEVDRIVLGDGRSTLSTQAQETLHRLSVEKHIEIVELDINLLLGETNGNAITADRTPPPVVTSGPVFSIDEAQAHLLSSRPYWAIKRGIDVLVSITLLLLLFPLFLLTATLVLFDVGRPVLFRQSRPGLGGRQIQIVKFRTMTGKHTVHGRQVADAERTSELGSTLRRFRLDELPQLVSILAGKMSFVGPRPLLPIDQPAAADARLLIRPGLTGWAQVAGGRLVSPEDKVALDLWYIRNASLLLDIKIVWMTIRMLVWGDRRDVGLIAAAWSELYQEGIVPIRTEPAE